MTTDSNWLDQERLMMKMAGWRKYWRRTKGNILSIHLKRCWRLRFKTFRTTWLLMNILMCRLWKMKLRLFWCKWNRRYLDRLTKGSRTHLKIFKFKFKSWLKLLKLIMMKMTSLNKNYMRFLKAFTKRHKNSSKRHHFYSKRVRNSDQRK